jgi:protein-arginine kinase activator protein McsA
MAAKKGEAKEKPLDKMTVKELRDIGKEIPGIVGVHGMNKGELLTAIKAARGIEEKPKKRASASVSELKKKIKVLKGQRQAALQAQDRQKATILRRRISRLKKQTRKAA